DMMLEQRGITDLGGTMRLGVYPCQLQPGSHASAAYGQKAEVEERHRHRFEFNNDYREVFEQNGMRFSGISPDGKLVEIAEIVDHPFMVGSQFHPEFLSRPNAPHPLFLELVKQAIEFGRARQHNNGYNVQDTPVTPVITTEVKE
ncbi:partial CTP synthase, partial [uncultured bacterium]